VSEITGMQLPGTPEQADHTAVAPDVERAVIEWLRAELDDPQIAGSDNFLDVGGHSLTFSRLNTFLAGSFGIALDMKTAYEHSISRAVADMRPSEATCESEA
jgi:Phosphopantetheine attachment site